MDKYFSQRFIVKPEEFSALMRMRIGTATDKDKEIIDHFLDHVAKRRGFTCWPEACAKENPEV